MTMQDIADLLFTPIQEDAGESIDPPWAVKDAGVISPRFEINRIGNTLRIRDAESGKNYLLELREV